ncbi:hypothetical protein BH18ACT15_BH18ACT15_02190 [soil metagenome]
MPLSEREQRIFEDIETRLLDEDPKLARRRRRRSLQGTGWQRLRAGLALFLLGLGLLFVFFLWGTLFVCALAFGAMVAGIVLAAGALKDIAASSTQVTTTAREGLRRRVLEWQERMRRRYKRP